MDTFLHIETTLSELERLHFERIAAHFSWTDKLRSCMTGGVQFAAVDAHHRKRTGRLPVVCTVGINYTQGGKDSTHGLFHYLQRTSGSLVVDKIRSEAAATAYAIAAYNRNRGAWTEPSALEPKSPVWAYASIGATTKTADLISDDPDQLESSFILVMTNLCPFITRLPWRQQAKSTPETCKYLLCTWPSNVYLDNLFNRLGGSVDLWIGHSAIYGTCWVWPEFSKFVQRNDVREWLLTPNINPQAHLWLDGEFRKKSHRLFPLFGPEKRSLVQ